eukprot:jgi/Botrbrau1/954/Bobra.114_1s0001.3
MPTVDNAKFGDFEEGSEIESTPLTPCDPMSFENALHPYNSNLESRTGTSTVSYTEVPQLDHKGMLNMNPSSNRRQHFQLDGGHPVNNVWRCLRQWQPMGLRQSPELWAIAIAYYVQGVKTEMAVTAERFLMKDDLGLSAAQSGVWRSIAHVPWMVKPLYGFITDTFPIRGERRRPYMFACGLAGAVAFGFLGGVPLGPYTALLLMTVSELSIAFIDVTVDGVVVERTRGAPLETAGALQSLCWGSQAAGRLSSAYSTGWLISRAGARPVLLLMVVFPLMIAVASQLIREAPACTGSTSEDKEALDMEKGREGVKQQAMRLLAALFLPSILLPAVFIFVWHATPTLADAMFYFYTDKLHFSAEFIGRIHLLDGVAQLVGVVLFNRFLKRIELRTLFLWLSLIGFVCTCTQLILVTGWNQGLGLPDKLFVVFDSVLLTGLGRIAMMPVLVLAARICPEVLLTARPSVHVSADLECCG